jgi:hypothetical protein
MQKLPVISLLMLVLATGAPASRSASASSKVQSVVQAQAQLQRSAAGSQKRIDQISAATQGILDQYLSIARQTDQLRSYDDQLQQFIQAQQVEIGDINQQMSQVGVVEHGLLPLMSEMVDSLEQYIKLDIPYRLDERLAAVQQLRDTLNDPAISVADRFQKVIQAYDAEIAAGKVMETYRGDKQEDGRTQTVNFLRLGHLLLVYQTLDRGETGYWDRQKHQWQVANRYADAVAEGIAMANKQGVPVLLPLPVPAAQAEPGK